MAIDIGARRRMLILPALFDEGNKLRHFTIETMRALALERIDSLLPDLPGCNESMAPLSAQSLSSWREAAAAAARHFAATHVLTFRGGALIAPDGFPGICYAPAAGASLLRAMLRARVIASREAGLTEDRDTLLADGRTGGLALAGYDLGPAMIRDLEPSKPAALPAITQSELPGGALWSRSEPRHDPAQSAVLARLVAERLG